MMSTLLHLDRLRKRLVFRAALTMIALPVLLAVAAVAQSSDALYGPHGIDPVVVRQGHLGSCYFHASIAALARTNPDVLRNAISGDAASGYTVKFPLGVTERVEQQDVDFARERAFDRSEGEWVGVLMRGYAQAVLRYSLIGAIDDAPAIFILFKPVAKQMVEQSGTVLLAYDRAIRQVVHQDGDFSEDGLKVALAEQLIAVGIPKDEAIMFVRLTDTTGFYRAIANVVRENGELFGAYHVMGHGGLPYKVLAVFEGKAQGADTSGSDLITQLQRVHSDNLAMVAGTHPTGPPLAPELIAQGSSNDWYVQGHAYTVVDYNDADQTVVLRNPWGTKPDPNGIFRIPLSVFKQAYDRYFY